ncbi:hypothetical protein ACSBR1_036055 [Camellia fascicularis]
MPSGKEAQRIGQSLSDFGKAVKLLGACEGNALGKVFSELGAKSEVLSIKLQKEATVAERANTFSQQYELAETIKLKEIDLNKFRLTRSEKLAEAEREYEVMREDSEEATRRFETVVRLMNEEFVCFQEQKTLDMGVAFHEFAKGQARLATGIADAWRSLLPKLEACSS